MCAETHPRLAYAPAIGHSPSPRSLSPCGGSVAPLGPWSARTLTSLRARRICGRPTYGYQARMVSGRATLATSARAAPAPKLCSTRRWMRRHCLRERAIAGDIGNKTTFKRLRQRQRLNGTPSKAARSTLYILPSNTRMSRMISTNPNPPEG